MNHGSLFSGIGGFDLAAEWMGWANVFHVERDPFCQQVLRHHFPKSDSHEDIKEFDGTAYAGRVNIISGGFPCQPFSAAGKRGGTSDDRYLWPEMFRIIREARPTYVVAENVRGLISWNDGLVLDTVCADLEGEGYEVFSVVLPAASVNAPHRRDRIWIVANRNHAGSRDAVRTDGNGTQEVGKGTQEPEYRTDGINGYATNANGYGLQRCISTDIDIQPPSSKKLAQERIRNATKSQVQFEDFPTVAPVCGGDDGLPQRLDGITFPKWRRESIKAYGNAIVPQVAYQIFRAIEQDVQGGL